MRNYIATYVIAAASLASCTQNEDFTSQYNEKAKTMKFDVAYVGKNTRATGDLTSIDDKKFILWGAAYERTYSSNDPSEETYVCSNGLWITNKEPLTFAKSSGEGASGYWEVDGESEQANKEVAYPGSTYRTYFTAIAPSDEFEAAPAEGTSATKATYSMAGQKSESTTPPSSSTRKLTLENIPVVQEINNTSNPKKGTDYLIACQSSISEEVSLTFKHLLSKLRFAVWTDENTVPTTGGETTKIELNSLKIYLPKIGTAKYEQTKHNDVKGTWTWSGFTNNATTPDETNYQSFEIYNESTGKDVNYIADANTAHSNFEQIKLNKNFFIAPTGDNDNVNLYIDIEYTVKRKVNGSWSTTNEESKKNEEGQVYSAGHKVVTRTKMLVPINDGTHPDDSNNEGLSHFHQGYIETLYICLRADQKVTFSTNFDVDDWVKDPIDGKQL